VYLEITNNYINKLIIVYSVKLHEQTCSSSMFLYQREQLEKQSFL